MIYWTNGKSEVKHKEEGKIDKQMNIKGSLLSGACSMYWHALLMEHAKYNTL